MRVVSFSRLSLAAAFPGSLRGSFKGALKGSLTALKEPQRSLKGAVGLL